MVGKRRAAGSGLAPDAVLDFVQRVLDDTGVRVAAAVEAASRGAVEDLRDGIAQAGISNKARNFLGYNIYPRRAAARVRASLGTTGYIHARGPVATLALTGWSEGGDARPRSARMLAVPTPAGAQATRLGARGGGRGGWNQTHFTPAEFERAAGVKLRYIPPRGDAPAMLVLDGYRNTRSGRAAAIKPGSSRRGRSYAVIFWLVPQVRLPHVLRPSQVLERWAGRIPALMQAARGAE